MFLSSTIQDPNINDIASSVETISSAINNYGVAIVIFAVFFVIFMILIVVMLISNIKMTNQIMSKNSSNDAQNQELVSKVVTNALESKGVMDSNNIVESLTQELKESLSPIEDAVLNNGNKKEDDYHKDIVGAYIDINMAFKDISRYTMNILKCDRVAIYVFHNGNKSLYGLPFFKMSCIHEWTCHGNMTLRGKSHTDMPLHLYNDFVENLWKYGVYKSDDIEKSFEDDPSLKDFMSFSKSKSLYIVAIKDMDGAVTGFVETEFPDADTFEIDDSRDIYVRSIIDEMINKIAPIVGSKYIYNKHE